MKILKLLSLLLTGVTLLLLALTTLLLLTLVVGGSGTASPAQAQQTQVVPHPVTMRVENGEKVVTTSTGTLAAAGWQDEKCLFHVEGGGTISTTYRGKAMQEKLHGIPLSCGQSLLAETIYPSPQLITSTEVATLTFVEEKPGYDGVQQFFTVIKGPLVVTWTQLDGSPYLSLEAGYYLNAEVFFEGKNIVNINGFLRYDISIEFDDLNENGTYDRLKGIGYTPLGGFGLVCQTWDERDGHWVDGNLVISCRNGFGESNVTDLQVTFPEELKEGDGLYSEVYLPIVVK